MAMRKYILAAVLAFAVCACTNRSVSPVEAAIKERVAAQLGELKYLEFSNLELVDSSTFADEISRRRATIELRHSQNLKLAEKYRNEGKQNNEAAKLAAAAKDEKVLKGIDALEERLAAGDSLNVTELYVYRFSGRARTADGNTNIENMFIAITPQNEIMAMDYKKDAVLKGTGKLIPGYQALFD
jgi:hypothetical protein